MQDIKNMTMYQAFENAAKSYPKTTAIYFLGKKISFQKALQFSNECAAGFNTMALNAGDTVTICLPNIPNAVFAFYGANKLGLIANMLHPLTPASQIIQTMKRTNSKHILLLDLVYAKNKEVFDNEDLSIILCSVSDFLPTLKAIALDIKNHSLKKKAKRLSFFELLSEKETKTASDFTTPSVYLHSGGTTGSPKTIMLSNQNFNALAGRAEEILGHGRTDDMGMLAVLPMFHGFGLCMAVHAPLVNGFTTILVPQFSVKTVTSIMNKTTTSYICGVPTMYEKLLTDKRFTQNKKLKKLCTAFCGGDSMPSALKDKFDKLMSEKNLPCRLYEGYGLTETVTVCSVNTDLHNKAKSIGKILSNLEIKIVDDKGNILPPNTNGEICVKGDTVMLGYLGDEEGTNLAVREGFVHTGDLGYVDEEGYIFFKQRLKRIVKVSGVAVFPSEIEDEASKLKEVKLCSAIPVDDEKSGQAVKLFVVLNDGFEKSEKTEQDILNALKKTLIRWAVPKYVQFKDTLPTTLVGKVDFKTLIQEEEQKENS